MYKKRNGPRGRFIYFHNNKMVSVKNIPEEVLAVLEYQNEVEEKLIPVPRPARVCLFCGEFGKNERIVNMQTVVLCDEHYYSETIGKIAQRLRETTGEGAEQAEEEHQEAEKVGV